MSNMNIVSLLILVAIVYTQANILINREEVDQRLRNVFILSSDERKPSFLDFLLTKDNHFIKFSKRLNEPTYSLNLRPNILKRSVTAYCQTQDCLRLLQQYEQQLQRNGLGVYGGRWL
ncbi:hypothetical protein CHS0354_012397 [Potamilus streckersoni]|uniref:Uncharacterized protein n=1 Tax=Potamilus streckersoni TaxID=2493646 RepID=A0AAE0VMF5_9BIVA|nr:hypothetical protein CHS0354_012397 [Potamilus streckersoni]